MTTHPGDDPYAERPDGSEPAQAEPAHEVVPEDEDGGEPTAPITPRAPWPQAPGSIPPAPTYPGPAPQGPGHPPPYPGPAGPPPAQQPAPTYRPPAPPYQPAPYQSAPYQPAPYQPAPYQPAPYRASGPRPPARWVPQPGYPPQGLPPSTYDPFAIPPDHPQAVTSMIVGILGLASIFMFCGVGLVASPFAWALGRSALRDIEATNGGYRGEAAARTGMYTGIVGTVILALGILAGVLLVLIALLAPSTGGSSI